VLAGIAGHTAMGIAMGRAFARFLLTVDHDRVLSLIKQNAAPQTTTLEFVGFVVSTFAIGTTLTGLAFMLPEQS
jgi:hypothetical protein